MSMELCILASGSAGNCAIVRSPGSVMLIDLGIGPRVAARRLAGTGVAIADVGAVCLTHLDGDHFNANWIPTLLNHNIRVFCHYQRVEELVACPGGQALAHLVRPFDGEVFMPFPELSLRPLRFAHDRDGSHGFLIEAGGARVGYATDLGRVTAELLEHFQEVDILALESNYDPLMQQNSSRPLFLKQRITGGCGHLSNQQAFAAVRAILDRCQEARRPLPRHIVLLHRSRQCNCPRLLRELFSADERIARRLLLAEQHERSPWLHAAAVGQQMTLF